MKSKTVLKDVIGCFSLYSIMNPVTSLLTARTSIFISLSSPCDAMSASAVSISPKADESAFFSLIPFLLRNILLAGKVLC